MTDFRLFFQAGIELIAHDIFMARHDFASLHCRVKAFPLRKVASESHAIETVSSSLDIACAFYPKQALCLQRSAVLVKMLRRKGVAARMIIGAQKLPFKAHAWVEVDGNIINDRLAAREKFLVLEVC
jgi:hypothetical protein